MLLYNGSCKNAASRKWNPENASEEEDCFTTQKATETNKNERLSKDSLDSLNENRKHPKPLLHNQPIKPGFTLKDMTIEAGKPYDAVLECRNLTEGYVIKSVSIIKDSTTSYVKHFNLETLKNRPISIHGCAFTVTPLQNLKPGKYFLTLTLGKYGKGSSSTLQSIKCIITLFHTEIAQGDPLSHPKTTSAPSMKHCSTQTTISGTEMQSMLRNSSITSMENKNKQALNKRKRNKQTTV